MEKDNIVVLNENTPCCTGSSCCKDNTIEEPDIINQRHLTFEDRIDTSVGSVPVVSTELKFRDHFGTFKARLNIGRMNYRVDPGLYAVGKPGPESLVFVSANYKMSFDYLRRGLHDMNAWILVLDTKGINVWCAAGKGTFGTDEIINRINKTNLEKIVSHRQLLVPQLGATGVASHVIKKEVGFKVIYGPVRASEIKDFINSDMKADQEMRTVRFNMLDRLILTPIEITNHFKYIVLIISAFFVLSGLSSNGFSGNMMINDGSRAAIFMFIAFLTGTVLTPVLLPFIPGSAFSFKGFFIISLVFLMMLGLYSDFFNLSSVEIIAWFPILGSISSYTAMNFTGASTYTSLTGVEKEMRVALPLQGAGFIIGFIVWVISRFI